MDQINLQAQILQKVAVCFENSNYSALIRLLIHLAIEKETQATSNGIWKMLERLLSKDQIFKNFVLARPKLNSKQVDDCLRELTSSISDGNLPTAEQLTVPGSTTFIAYYNDLRSYLSEQDRILLAEALINKPREERSEQIHREEEPYSDVQQRIFSNIPVTMEEIKIGAAAVTTIGMIGTATYLGHGVAIAAAGFVPLATGFTIVKLWHYYKEVQERADTQTQDELAYSALGLNEMATLEEVNSAYRRKAREVHPDKQNGNEEEFKALTAFRDHLVAKYD